MFLPLPFTWTTPPTPVIRYPDRTSRRVDLPAPEGPMIATSCLGRSRPFTPCRICFEPARKKEAVSCV